MNTEDQNKNQKKTLNQKDYNNSGVNPRNLSATQLENLNMMTSSLAKLVKCTICPIKGNCKGYDKNDNGCALRAHTYLRWIGSKKSKVVRAHELLGMVYSDLQFKILVNDVQNPGKGMPDKLIKQSHEVHDRLLKLEVTESGSKVNVTSEKKVDALDLQKMFIDAQNKCQEALRKNPIVITIEEDKKKKKKAVVES